MHMNFNETKDRLKETYKSRKCEWCKKPCKECDPKCKCYYCTFEDSYDSISGDYQHIKDWIMSNLKFFEKLYVGGLAETSELIRVWKRRQLFTFEKTGTRILDWDTDNEVIGVPRSDHAPPDNYQIITPYHDHRKPKSLDSPYCQLCGKDLTYSYFIKHDEKKLSIRIGHECAEAFCLTELFVQILKNQMRTIVEEEFTKLKNPLKKWLKKQIKTHPKNTKWYIRQLERITRYFESTEYKITAQNISKLLLESEKKGFKKYLEDKKIQRKSKKDSKNEVSEKPENNKKMKKCKDEELSQSVSEKESKIIVKIDESIRKIIFLKIKKLSGNIGYAVRKDRIIQHMLEYGLTENETIAYLEDMLQRKDIFEFLPNQYKIPERLL